MGSGSSAEDIGEQWEKLEKDLKKENNDFTKLIERTVQNLNSLTDAKLDIAITGLTGAGKSSLVNALRGMTDDEEGAAEAGVIQTTMERKPYPHPKFPNVTLWDLPGFGTREFVAQKYMQEVHFMEYDFFIIVATVQFTTNDVLLAKEIHKMNKKFYYVRTKVDTAIESERRRQNFDEEKTLEKIRKYCCDDLAKTGELHPRVFLVSSHHCNRYDFQLLLEVMGNELDEIKRYAFITALSNSSKERLKQKKAAMKDLVEKVALLSSSMGASPVPGLPLVCNVHFLKEKMRDFSMVFGLDKYSLHQLAKQVGKPFPMLSSAIKKTTIASEIDSVFVKTLLSSVCTSERSRLLDYLSWVYRMFCNSSAAISNMLLRFLDDAEEDAENVLAKAVGN